VLASQDRLPHTNGWWVSSLAEFASSRIETVVGQLSSAAAQRGLPVTREQHLSWQTSVGVLLATATSLLSDGVGASWGVIVEFELPRRAVRPDAVILACDVIVPVEFKVGATNYERSARMQVEEYAWDLRDFHESSHGHPIVPVLVATEATNEDTDLGADPIADRAQCTRPASLAALLPAIVDRLSTGGPQLDARAWSTARYRPSPGILETAREVYAGNDVRSISVSYADNLGATVDAVRQLIARSRERDERLICFITGVPGSGKTLAGLTAVHEHVPGTGGRALGAYLSGNGPLVQVLRYAIAVDLMARKGTRMREARRLASTFIQPVHRFVQELARSSRPPPEHVVVFDEAQRAWDRRRMELKQGIPLSEAATMLSIMERVPDWSVVIALIGEGQEINTGEAGIDAWLEALSGRPQWRICASGSVIARAGALADRIESNDALELDVSVRSPRASVTADWAEAVTAGKLSAAKEYAAMCDDFPLLLTRDLGAMRAYLRDRARPDRRTGLLASSQARRLRPFGIEMDGTFQGGIDWPRWFVDEAEDIRSSYVLEVAASEFKCQGLEIDWAGLCWGSDFTWDRVMKSWQVRRLSGGRWLRDNDEHHARNRYRVLLTRARYGLVVWVPKPSREIPLVDVHALEQTAEALLAAGCEML
jgi:hypothetical protein